jgi:hypothetical protein
MGRNGVVEWGQDEAPEMDLDLSRETMWAQKRYVEAKHASPTDLGSWP